MKQKFLSQIAAISTASLIFAGSPWQAAQGQQRPTSLFSSSCISQGGGSSASGRDVVIGREIFSEVYRIIDGTQVTCRIRPAGSEPRYGTLRLAFGRPDSNDRSISMQVVIYLDGSQAASRTIFPGDKAFVVLDVSRSTSVAIDVSISRYRGFSQTASFSQALLEPISVSPGQR